MPQQPVVHRWQAGSAYLVGALAFALALWAELALARVVGAQFVFAAFSVAVVVAVCVAGRAAGVLTILMAALAADYFLLAPGSLWSAGGPAHAAVLFGFVGVWLPLCWWIDSLRRRRRLAVDGHVAAARAAAHARRVLQLTGALALSRTPEAVIEAAVQEPMHALGADAGLFLLVEEDGSCTVARSVAHAAESSRTIAAAADSPVGAAIERRAPVLVGSREAWQAEFPRAAADPDWLPYAALVAVPLVARGRVAAVIVFAFHAPQVFTPDDGELLATLGVRAAVSLDRTWQHELAQRARLEAERLRQRADQELAERQRTEQALRASETRYRALATRTSRLHALTAALSEAVTLDAVAKALVQHGNVVVGASGGEVALLAPPHGHPQAQADGAASRLHVLHADPAPRTEGPRQLALTAGLAATDAIATQRPIFIPSWAELQERYWQSALAAADAAYASSAILPLIVESAPVGVLSFHFSVPVNFDPEYQALLVSVAQHCAQALDRARLYESAERARSEAEDANRLKDEFLSIVSHELRTPLNAVLGWGAMLQKPGLDPSLARRAVQSICDNAGRQAKLIDDLLDATRIVAGQTTLDVQDVRVAQLIGGVVESVMPMAASRQIDLRVAGDLPPAVVRGDLRRLEQVVFNLLGNALKFTPQGGRIVVEARMADEVVELRVSDTGIGIDPAFLPHVFDRFRQQDSTAARSYGGLGLGLSIARQLVEAHGGTIAASSAGRHQGASFLVRLPLLQRDVERARPSKSPSREAVLVRPRLDGVRVLVVDDDPDARELMGHALGSCGARVALADSAAAALNVLGENQVDALLADIAMPDEDGYSLLRKIRASANARVASLPAAAISAHARAADREEAYAAGFQVHLAKPVQPILLARTVEQLVHSRAHT